MCTDENLIKPVEIDNILAALDYVYDLSTEAKLNTKAHFLDIYAVNTIHRILLQHKGPACPGSHRRPFTNDVTASNGYIYPRSVEVPAGYQNIWIFTEL